MATKPTLQRKPLHFHSRLLQDSQSAALSLIALSTNPKLLPGPDVYVKIHPSNFCITHPGSWGSWTGKNGDISSTKRCCQILTSLFSSQAISPLNFDTTKARWKVFICSCYSAGRRLFNNPKQSMWLFLSGINQFSVMVTVPD